MTLVAAVLCFYGATRDPSRFWRLALIVAGLGWVALSLGGAA